jgi:hypothetical protein
MLRSRWFSDYKKKGFSIGILPDPANELKVKNDSMVLKTELFPASSWLNSLGNLKH